MKVMRKFLFACTASVALGIMVWYLCLYRGFYLPIHASEPAAPLAAVDGKTVTLQQPDGSYAPFEIRGVDISSALPGHFSTEYAIDKETYLRWFEQIQALGANTIRVYTVQNTAFYEAVYEYNCAHETPLYLLHGVALSDYTQFSHREAFDSAFLNQLIYDSKLMVDVIHGKRIVSLGAAAGTGSYTRDISPWVIGYILGGGWEDLTVAYTDDVDADRNSYTGQYLSTTPDASAFEAMLTQLGDAVVEYETNRYGSQRMLSFSNAPATDPFTYSQEVTQQFRKCARIDVEHIKASDAFVAGQFAAYHVYPGYPDYLRYELEFADFVADNAAANTYRAYLEKLVDHHTMPVIISEYGVPSARGMTQRDTGTGRSQGGLNETEQAQAVVDCYQDIQAAGCAGSVAFVWQDEWYKDPWNALYAIDRLKTPYWSNYQASEQFFGLLSFEPGAEASVCTVDGSSAEWADVPELSNQNGTVLKMQYDEKFVYFFVTADGLTPQEPLYLPLDTTQKTGGLACDNYDLRFDRAADFVIALDGAESRVVVQERYCVLRAMGSDAYEIDNPYSDVPAADSTAFWSIDAVLRNSVLLEAQLTALQNGELVPTADDVATVETYETGKLKQGNADPSAPDYDSLADYCYGENCVEIRLPWQLLNFSNPSEMEIHDDYYAHYGVEAQKIKTMYVGAARGRDADEEITLQPLAMKGWGKSVTTHERLKPAYYALQALWQAG